MKKFRRVIAVALLFVLMSSHFSPCFAALTITSSVITDWTAVAVQATGESAVIDLSGNYATAVHIQAFLDSATAHEGTEFRVQVSGLSSGDEDWTDFHVFKALIGTANTEPITNNPLAAASTTITVADTGGLYETEPMGKWIAIEDTTLINSELIWQVAFVADTSITCQDGTTNAHVQTIPLYDIAISKTVYIGFGIASRARVIINNGVDLDGTASTLNFKVGKTVTTALN